MSNHSPAEMAWWKILIAWIGVGFGSIDMLRSLTIIALILTITFTALQIYKLWRELVKERKSEEFAEKMKAPETGAGTL